ncbi:MAG: ATP synthase F1 subunit gamma [Candidatus Ryanbacteria bacterium RIFCSPHIGHO2_02_FULL_45_17b]|uniref:ATP synthase gamma chain n=1 Tax=Candidatus Ryanbacteria bacterium RIFCSPHIGHO2_01_FULL_45_22 TaxID=1802114 RepID=A0A1G2G1F6_9BACT|nr:MAG: ATP synthase F1 subunit gamma [Candidatus Ryanbacteria bacterium RIFCSPHIGHO2_01_FULL_45_22]OGZ47062.1 MAG: ATP synthase F1 subunit gamma [Candidatus Ryanbacteria bacterium RIFCSPHIGHO2_02_FULL_45_17b]
MQSLQTIKQRLRSVKNIGQITKAMELVAATKMRKSQEVALLSRPYAYVALEFLANLSRVSVGYMPPLMEKRPIEKTAVVVVASDKGLTGSFNSAVFRAFEKYVAVQPLRMDASTTTYIAVGQKAVSYLMRRGETIEQSFVKFGDYTNIEEVRPLADYLISGYLEKTWDRVLIFYTNFRSAMQQDVVVRELFPVTFEKLKETAEEIIPQTGKYAAEGHGALFQTNTGATEKEYIIEPSPEAVLRELVPHLIIMQVYHIILEANASEHAARRMAMKNASDNASDIVDDLTLEYNKSRQAGITKELTEITAGAEALS